MHPVIIAGPSAEQPAGKTREAAHIQSMQPESAIAAERKTTTCNIDKIMRSGV